MIIPSIADKDRILASNEVRERVSLLSARLTVHAAQKIVGLYADLSVEGVMLTLASIKMGLQVAFCHPREPGPVHEAWLQELNIDTLYSSIILPKEYSATLKLHHIDAALCIGEKLELDQKSDAFMSILRTSGTGAKPKSACISGRAHLASAQQVNAYFDFNERSWWALPLPLAHVSGLSILFRALLSGGGIHVVRNHQELISALRAKHLSHCSLVPAQLKRLLDETIDCSAMSALIIGGDRLMPADRDDALKRGWPLYECYGMTETASMIAVRKSSSALLELLPHAQMRQGPDNEILVRGTSLFSGYMRDGHVVLPLEGEGFFPTGDRCAGADFNQLQLICRKNNRIISGGENIQAEEIEEALEEHPAIDLAVVVGLPDRAMGMRPHAYIKWRTLPHSLLQLQPFLKERLARYKWPDSIFSWPEDLIMTNKKPRLILSERAHQEMR